MIRNNSSRPQFPFLLIVLVACTISATDFASAQTVQARSDIEYNEIFLGEEFNYHINVYQFPTPDEPDLSNIKDFTVQSASGSPSKKEYIYDIRGMRARFSIREGYVFYYRLRPKKLGNFQIPPIPVKAGNRNLLANPQRIRVIKPRLYEGSKLNVKLSTDVAYIGQPINLEMTWNINTQAREHRFALPILLENEYFDATIIEPEDAHLDRLANWRFPVNGKETITKNKSGNPYIVKGTLKVQAILIPKKNGTPKIDAATVSFLPYTIQRDAKGRSLGARQNKNRHITFSNIPNLEIRDLPAIGRPENFSGIIGNFIVSASVDRTEVKVGDPITLKINLKGPGWLKNITLPPLHKESYLNEGFKILADRAPGTVAGNTKTFTKVLRARSRDVTEIPPIRIPFFDTSQGKYIIAATDRIPLKVLETKRIASALGGNGVKKAIAQLNKGIGHNYPELDAVQNQFHGLDLWIRSPLWSLMIFTPPILWALLFALATFLRKQQADPEGPQITTSPRRPS